ncbi:cytochrome P450 [Jidongwangia harbinensis]|uniref:cytochrome P450 n=1 Tax=Jidongwangia harbinensis TaxID=2878561 RepID=UPI001CD98CA8|nr:cytochrome P450 [Jidongwangia harbinensis]MCA2218140.1 cytochrome P450 [Jidongwangia harbinensis]
MVDTDRTAQPTRTAADLDGPKPVPLLGNLPEFTRGRVTHRVLERWCDEYGLTYRFHLARHRVVVTADPKVLDVVMRKRPDDFRRSGLMAGVLDEIIPTGVFTAEGDQWRRLRKMATQSLNVAYLRQYFTTITQVTERLTRLWDRAADSGESIDVLDQMMRYTLDVTVALAMGHDLNGLETTGEGLHSRLPKLFPEFARRIEAPFPYWRYVRLPRDRRLDATVREIEAVVRERFVEARARVASGADPANFLEALVKPLEDEPAFTDDEVFGNMMHMLLGGEDTTSSTAAWTLHYLAEHPDVHRKVRAEADEVLGDRKFPADPAMVGRLKYAEAVVNEVQRLRPVAPYLVMQPLKDVTLDTRDGRLHLPALTVLFVLIAYGARRDQVRFPEPETFRPERWLDGSMPPESLPYTPFGNGPRFCPGRNLAMIEATMLASVLARGFDLEPDRSAGEVGEYMTFTAFPTNVAVRVRRRG